MPVSKKENSLHTINEFCIQMLKNTADYSSSYGGEYVYAYIMYCVCVCVYYVFRYADMIHDMCMCVYVCIFIYKRTYVYMHHTHHLHPHPHIPNTFHCTSKITCEFPYRTCSRTCLRHSQDTFHSLKCCRHPHITYIIATCLSQVIIGLSRAYVQIATQNFTCLSHNAAQTAWQAARG